MPELSKLKYTQKEQSDRQHSLKYNQELTDETFLLCPELSLYDVKGRIARYCSSRSYACQQADYNYKDSVC